MRLIPSCLDPCLPASWRSEKKTILQLRMDQLAKAFVAAHAAMDVMDDERQIARLKKAEKITKQVHAEVHPGGSFLRGLMRHDSSSSSSAGAAT